MADLLLQLETIVSPPFEENTYVAHWPGRDDCLVIDPGFDVESIVEYVESKRLTPAVILNTHGHVDHIAGNAAMKERWPDAPLVIGRGDAAMLPDPAKNLSQGFGFAIISPPADMLVEAGNKLEWAGFALEVLFVPGHSPGHVAFVSRAGEAPVCFGGDTLFAGGIGRSDFPGGDADTLAASIRTQLFTLPDNTIVYPGHGPPTTIGFERVFNPFVGERA